MPHDGLVMESVGVKQSPTSMAKIVEASKIPAEIRTRLKTTPRALGILEIRIHLDLLAKPGSFDLDKSCSHSLHETSVVVKGHSPRTNRVLVLVSIKTSVYNTPE